MGNVTDILIQAGLLNEVQVQVALHDQTIHPDMRISEILALRGWLAEETVDFFELLWAMRVQQADRRNIGQYFLEARLITEAQLNDVLAEQKISTLRFGEIAVLKGYVKEETVRFFVQHLFPQNLQLKKVSPLSRATNSTATQAHRRTMANNMTLQQTEETVTETNQRYQQQKQQQSPEASPPPNQGLFDRIKRQVKDKIAPTDQPTKPLPPSRSVNFPKDAGTSFDLSETEDPDDLFQ
jgi:hypothetical protein